jgi:hypothetical protein
VALSILANTEEAIEALAIVDPPEMSVEAFQRQLKIAAREVRGLRPGSPIKQTP